MLDVLAIILGLATWDAIKATARYLRHRGRPE